MRARISIIVACLFWAATARAQVNVEPIRAQLVADGHAAQLRAAVTGRTGNTDGLTVGAGALVGLSGDFNLFYVTGSADYAQANGETSMSKAFGHARYNRRFFRWLWGEVFTQSETDRFRRMRLRALAGTGPRFIIWEATASSLAYGASYMLESTQRNDSVDASFQNRLDHRFNNYSSLNVAPHPAITLSETVYYQPRFDEFTDYWLLSVFSAQFRVTELLSTHLDFTIRHESTVPDNVDSTDTELLSSLALTF